MPSLRKKVSSYFRQLSFHNEPKSKRHGFREISLVIQYLEGHTSLKEGPRILHGKTSNDLPMYELGPYECGYDSIIGCYTGPGGGLTTIKRSEKHLSVSETDIDFIDTIEEPEEPTHFQKPDNQPIDNSTMVIKVGGQEYYVSNLYKKHSRSHSLSSISDLNFQPTKRAAQKQDSNDNHDIYFASQISTGEFDNRGSDTPIRDLKTEENSTSDRNESNSNKENDSVANVSFEHNTGIVNSYGSVKNEVCVSSVEIQVKQKQGLKKAKHELEQEESSNKKYNINEVDKTKRVVSSMQKNMNNTSRTYKSKSVQNPPSNKSCTKDKAIKPKEKINKIHRQTKSSDSNSAQKFAVVPLPKEWNKNNELVFGISDSLYDTNQITKEKSGNPIADCFGIIARNDSAILAVADGVNWGEKACIAAKSAVHGSLYYLNKTMFSDTKLFENLSLKDESSEVKVMYPENPLKTTKDVFICLLRAFTCAHDLILENGGMLTTLTVAVVLPLKKKSNGQESFTTCRNTFSECQYVCCVCNVGDTLAYVYSKETGLRELTKGSHDINSNRDMRDALGALGPVDGMNPELSNLTLSLTMLKKGDIVMVASDGLTDNFDPNVCKFSTSHPFQDRIEKTQKFSQSSTCSKHSSHSSKSQIPSARSSHQESKHQHKKASVKNINSACSSQEKNVTENVLDKTEEISKNSKLKKQENLTANTSDNITEENSVVQNLFLASILDASKCDGNATANKNASVLLDVQDPYQDVYQKSVSDNVQTCKTLNKTSIQETKVKAYAAKSDRNTGYKILRSKTALDFSYARKKTILCDSSGLPYVTPLQRYELQLLLIEEVIRNGFSGEDAPCITAKQICENLLNYTLNITSAKRHTLENPELYFDNRNGLLVEVSSHEKRNRRKKALEKVQDLPGKLDHVTLVAYNVGNVAL